MPVKSFENSKKGCILTGHNQELIHLKKLDWRPQLLTRR